MKQINLGLVGAGERGMHCYAPYALKYPKEVRFTCVAEPDERRRHTFGDTHNIPPEKRYAHWREMLAEQNADLDGVIIATQDRQHFEPAMRAFEQGLDVLCEKPIAETYEKSREMVRAAEQNHCLLMVCHVLRYTPFFMAMKNLLDAGAIGEIQAVQHFEGIGNWHFSHSYVRGNWRKSGESAPMIVAKCSHDMDILNYLLGRRCLRITSFGGLHHFNREHAPPNAAPTCSECALNKQCNYSAFHYYEDGPAYRRFRKILENRFDNRPLNEILESSPYNRCVYFCDNDVPDCQVVQMEYESGITASFTVSAFSAKETRRIRVMGTKGELEGELDANAFIQRDFFTGNTITHAVYVSQAFHSGGDESIMTHFCEALRHPEMRKSINAYLSLSGHQMAFAAEESRLNGGETVRLDTF